MEITKKLIAETITKQSINQEQWLARLKNGAIGIQGGNTDLVYKMKNGVLLYRNVENDGHEHKSGVAVFLTEKFWILLQPNKIDW